MDYELKEITFESSIDAGQSTLTEVTKFSNLTGTFGMSPLIDIELFGS